MKTQTEPALALAVSPCCHDRLVKTNGQAAQCKACRASFGLSGGVLDLRVDQSYDTLLDTDQYDREHTVDADSPRTVVGVYERLLNKWYPSGHVFEDVLEIGSGTGNLTYGLASNPMFNRVHCSDLSPRFIAVLRDRMRRFGVDGNLSYYLFDANQVPFADESTNLVIGHSVLHHLSEFEETLRETHRALSRGGTALFGEPVLDMYVFVSLAALLILRTDRLIASRPFLKRRQVEALEIIGSRSSLSASYLRLEDRGILKDVEDKFFMPIAYMRKVAREIGFSDFYYSNQTDDAIDIGAEVRSNLAEEFERYGIDPTPLAEYEYVFDSLQTTYGDGMREWLPHMFGVFSFAK